MNRLAISLFILLMVVLGVFAERYVSLAKRVSDVEGGAPATRAVPLDDELANEISAIRFDLAKLLNLNAHYLRERPDEELVELIRPRLAANGFKLDEKTLRRLRLGMDGLKQRSRTLVELAESAAFYVRPRPMPVDEKARKLLDEDARQAISSLVGPLATVEDWREDALESVCRAQAGAIGVGFGKLAQPLRAC